MQQPGTLIEIKVGDVLMGSLLAGPFDEPAGNWPFVTYVPGRLIDEGNRLAAPDRAHPRILVSQSITSVARNANGGYDVTPDITMKVETGEGVGFQHTGYEVWVPGKS